MGVFLDMSKLFATIDNRILIKKLKNYSVQRFAQPRSQDVLSNRLRIFKYDMLS